MLNVTGLLERVGVDGVAEGLNGGVRHPSRGAAHEDTVGVVANVQVIHSNVGILGVNHRKTAALVPALGLRVTGERRTTHFHGREDAKTSTVRLDGRGLVGLIVDA